MSEAKKHAVKLLRKYDQSRRDLRELERELHAACAAYGRERGLWGFNKDHLRIQLQNETGAAGWPTPKAS